MRGTWEPAHERDNPTSAAQRRLRRSGPRDLPGPGQTAALDQKQQQRVESIGYRPGQFAETGVEAGRGCRGEVKLVALLRLERHGPLGLQPNRHASLPRL